MDIYLLFDKDNVVYPGTCKRKSLHRRIKINELAISELPLASFSKRVLVLIFSYENEISFTCKLNSFSYEWLSTRSRFEREALGNSEMVYSST